MKFQVSPLGIATFAPLFALSDEALSARHAVRRVVQQQPGFPCRVSLRDAEPGEKVILVHFEHHAVASPYRSSHAIYVRESASEARLEPEEVPTMLRTRLLSLRSFDGAGMMVDADVSEGSAIEASISRLLSASASRYIHIHFARPGCYAAQVFRA